jgi:hypothetical protein
MAEYTIKIEKNGGYASDTLAEATVTVPDSLSGERADGAVALVANTVVGQFADGIGHVISSLVKEKRGDAAADLIRALSESVKARRDAEPVADAPWDPANDLPQPNVDPNPSLAPQLVE